MDLFDIDILEGRVSKYETNHIHMIVDGNVALPITSMCNKDYGTFLHEYIHYLQHFTTLYGVKTCAMYNKMFNLYREHILKHDPIYLPLKLWTTDEKLSDFIAHKNKIEGSRTCSHNVDEVEVNNSDIEEARKNKTSVNIGIYDFENGKVEYKGFQFGYLCVIESMAHLIQSFISENTYHPIIPYHSVELVCGNYCKRIAEDKKMMISICLCSLMFDNPGVAFFDVIKIAENNQDLNGQELYEKIMRDYSVSYKGENIPMYRVLWTFLDDLKNSLGIAIGTELDYYNTVIEHCKEEAANGKSVLLDVLYNFDITDKTVFTEIFSNIYGYPYIEASNNTIFPTKPGDTKPTPYLETATMLGLELIIKRLLSTNSNTICGWLEICKKGMYDESVKCPVSPECQNNQWNKTEECLMTNSMDYFKIKNKHYIQE